MNLNQYEKYWDDFVENWYNNRANPQVQLIHDSQLFANTKYKGKCAFDQNELVEPYLGNPENCKFVIINYNPGGSQNSNKPNQGKESDKYYSNLLKQPPDGWLIKEFVNKCGAKYSVFLTKWSALNSNLIGNKPPVCGVSWWQGSNGNGGRMKWISSFYSYFDSTCQLSSDDVFALEMAPYHSIAKGNFVLDQNLQVHYINNVILPAGEAAKKTPLKMAVCVGDDFNKFFHRIKANRMREWDSNYFAPRFPKNMQIWPWKPVDRKYVLWKYTDYYYLVLSHSGGNYLPAKEFKKVDEIIAGECSRIIP